MSYDAYQSYQTVHLHAQTAQASPVQLVLVLMDGLLDELAAQASHLREAFAPLAKHGRVEHLRQRGMILAFDVVDAPAGLAEAFHVAARRHELLIRPIGRTVYLMPPYVVDAATAGWLADAVRATLAELFPHAS